MDKVDHSIPITLTNWLIALSPIIILFILLMVTNMSSYISGLIALSIGGVMSYAVFQAPIDNIGVALGKGAWDALAILLIVWSALLMYQIIRHAGAFDAIRSGVQKFSKNNLFLVLAFGWVFASFLQGVAGFGAPIAIVAPLLIGIGVKPIYAVIIPLISINWAKLFGSLGTSWEATIGIVNLESIALTVLFISLMLWIADITGGLMIAWLFGKGKAIKEALPAILILTLVQGGGQVIVSQFNPVLATFIPSIAAMGVVVLLSRWKRYSEPTSIEEDSPILDFEEDDSEQNPYDLSLYEALTPYLVLTVLTVVALGIPSISNFLEQVSFGFSFPEVSTGLDFTTEAVESYSPITIFTHPGFYLFVSSLFAYFWFKSKGAYQEENTLSSIGKDLYSDAIGATLSILIFLMMSAVLEHSGQNSVLAMGIAAVAPPPAVYAGVSTWIGVLGALMTSSSTSSNILFSSLHGSVVQTMSELSINQVIASQSAGGAIGNAIAPANVVVGASTAGIGKDETSQIYKIGFIFTLITGILITALSVLLYFLQ